MKKSNLFVILSVVIITTLFFLSGVSFAEGEWATNGNNIYNTNSGNVGIGTTNPGALLHINNDALNVEGTNFYGSYIYADKETGSSTVSNYLYGQRIYMRMNDADSEVGALFGLKIYAVATAGNVGNSSTPKNMHGISSESIVSGGDVAGSTFGGYFRSNLDSGGVGGNVYGTYSGIDIEAGMTGLVGNLYGSYIRVDDDTNTSGTAYLLYLNGGSNVDYGVYQEDTNLVNYFGSNVGIGTTSPQSKLAVNGTITTKEVNVTETGWSDFVFEEDYNLPSLGTIESFIKENKHLPDIPSAKEIEKKGLSMAEMMAKQMQKIEELTLYVIEQSKQIGELKKELAELKNMN